VIALLLAAASSVCPDAALKDATDIGSVIQALAQRSVAIVAGNPVAEQFVADNAEFSLIVGDVGGTIGRGRIGAANLSKRLEAATYEYAPWVSIPGPADPCAKQEVEIRFYDKSGESGASVKFQYERGRLIRAEGWNLARVAGPIPSSPR
jgi:hypothetical protein